MRPLRSWRIAFACHPVSILLTVLVLGAAPVRAAEMAPLGQYLPHQPVILSTGAFAYQVGPPEDLYRTRLVWLVAVLREHPGLPPVPGFIHGAISGEWRTVEGLPVEQRKAYLLALYKDIATVEVSELRATGWKYAGAVLAGIGKTIVTEAAGWGLGNLASVSLNKNIETASEVLGAGAAGGALAAFGGLNRDEATRYRSDLDIVQALVSGNRGAYAAARSSILASYLQLVCGCPLPLPGHTYFRPGLQQNLMLGETKFKYMTRFGRNLGTAPGGEKKWSWWDLRGGGMLSVGAVGLIQANMREEAEFLQRQDPDVFAYLAGIAYDLETVPLEWAERESSTIATVLGEAATEMMLRGAATASEGLPVLGWMTTAAVGTAIKIDEIREEERLAAVMLVLRNQVADALARNAGRGAKCIGQTTPAAPLVITSAIVSPSVVTTGPNAPQYDLILTYSGDLPQDLHLSVVRLQDQQCIMAFEQLNCDVGRGSQFRLNDQAVLQPGRIVIPGAITDCNHLDPRTGQPSGTCEYDIWFQFGIVYTLYQISPRYRLSFPRVRAGP